MKILNFQKQVTTKQNMDNQIATDEILRLESDESLDYLDENGIRVVNSRTLKEKLIYYLQKQMLMIV